MNAEYGQDIETALLHTHMDYN